MQTQTRHWLKLWEVAVGMKHAQLEMPAEVPAVLAKGKGDDEEELEEEWEFWLAACQLRFVCGAGNSRIGPPRSQQLQNIRGEAFGKKRRNYRGAGE